MGLSGRKLKPEQRARLAANIENLVWGLFGRKTEPFFDRGGIAPGLLEEFVQCEEVFDATFAFADTLMRIWLERYPGKPLTLQSRGSSGPIEPLVPPVFSESIGSRQMPADACPCRDADH